MNVSVNTSIIFSKKKLRKNARETLFLLLFKKDFQVFLRVLNFAMYDVFVATLLQSSKMWNLFIFSPPISLHVFFQYVKNDGTPFLAYIFFVCFVDC